MKDILIGIAYRTDEFKLIPFEKENIELLKYLVLRMKQIILNMMDFITGGDGWYSEDIKLIKYAKENNTILICLGMQEECQLFY